MLTVFDKTLRGQLFSTTSVSASHKHVLSDYMDFVYSIWSMKLVGDCAQNLPNLYSSGDNVFIVGRAVRGLTC